MGEKSSRVGCIGSTSDFLFISFLVLLFLLNPSRSRHLESIRNELAARSLQGELQALALALSAEDLKFVYKDYYAFSILKTEDGKPLSVGALGFVKLLDGD